MYNYNEVSRSDYQFEQHLKKQMYDYKLNACRAVSQYVHSLKAETFTKTLAWAYFNDSDDAKALANELGLTEQHFNAVLDYEQEFSKELVEEMINNISSEDF